MDTALVSLSDGRTCEAVRVGDDPATDLAVLRLSGNGFPHATFGSSAALRVDQLVIGVDRLHRLLTAERAGREVEIRLLRRGRQRSVKLIPEAD